MTLFLHNTLTRRKERFEPLAPDRVGLYVCGPTVYDYAHIGNARPVVVFDVLYRLLKRLYPQVTYVRNITDVDDKIIAAHVETGEPVAAITERTTAAFHDDMAALGALPPDVEPRATAHIAQMIAMIERLIAAGHAYEAEGHVLFDVPSWPEYGCLSRRDRADMVAGARVEVAPYKRDPADFVLWKPSTADQPGWDSPWGRGRPGWHIECSAMSTEYLGETFDIHGGGADLIFPHHENEIAQSTCAHEGRPFVRTWLHNGYLMVEGEKMSKSLGNFYTVHDLLAEFPGEAIRLVLLQTHYRAPLDFTKDALATARITLDRLYGALRDVQAEPAEAVPAPVGRQPAIGVPQRLQPALDLLLVRRLRQVVGVGVDVVQSRVALGRAAALREPLVEGVAELLRADVLPAAGLAEPVEEVDLVLVADDRLGHRLAVDDGRLATPPDVVVAVDEVAGVTRALDERREPEQPSPWVLRNLVEGPELARLGEHLVLLEPPAAEADTHFRHRRRLDAPG